MQHNSKNNCLTKCSASGRFNTAYATSAHPRPNWREGGRRTTHNSRSCVGNHECMVHRSSHLIQLEKGSSNDTRPQLMCRVENLTVNERANDSAFKRMRELHKCSHSIAYANQVLASCSHWTRMRNTKFRSSWGAWSGLQCKVFTL